MPIGKSWLIGRFCFTWIQTPEHLHPPPSRATRQSNLQYLASLPGFKVPLRPVNMNTSRVRWTSEPKLAAANYPHCVDAKLVLSLQFCRLEAGKYVKHSAHSLLSLPRRARHPSPFASRQADKVSARTPSSPLKVCVLLHTDSNRRHVGRQLKVKIAFFSKKEGRRQRRTTVRESGSSAYFPQVKPGVTASVSQTAPAGPPSAATALLLLLRACLPWGHVTHTYTLWSRLIRYGFSFVWRHIKEQERSS